MNDPVDLKEEANRCRETARDYMGRAEGPFLLRVARAFDDLAADLENGGASGRRPTA